MRAARTRTAVPGALDAGLADLVSCGSLAVSLGVAFVVTVPVDRAIICRGKATPWCTRTTTEPTGSRTDPPPCG